MAQGTTPGTPRCVAVIGAGIIGVCCALYLQRDGHDVLLIDYQGPGEGCSSGNAGQFSADSCTPNAVPGILLKVPGMLLDPLGPLTIRWRYLPRIAPWLVRLALATSPRRVRAASRALWALHRNVTADYDDLAGSAGASDQIHQTGRLELYASERAFADDAFKREMLEELGMAPENLTPAQVREHEPALSESPDFLASRRPQSAFVGDPLRFTQTLARHFERKGGTVLRERVTGFELGPNGPKQVVTDATRHAVDAVVVAAGAYSRKLVRALGTRVPLDTERGYHVMLPNPGFTLRQPITSQDYHFSMSPLDGGLRLAGTDEFAGVDAPPNYARADRLLEAARTIFPRLNAEGATRWMGCRPSMPDSVPVVSRSPVYPRSVCFAFGHGHLGISGAPMTGRLVADFLAGRPPTIDPHPYRVERFWP